LIGAGSLASRPPKEVHYDNKSQTLAVLTAEANVNLCG
jgi:hypothetical protein